MFRKLKFFKHRSSKAWYLFSLYITYKGFLNVVCMLMLLLFNSFML